MVLSNNKLDFSDNFIKSNDGSIDIDRMMSDLDNATEKQGGVGGILRVDHTDNDV